MKNQHNEGLSIQDLEVQKVGLQGRIKSLEADLRSPLDADPSEQAVQISNLIIFKRLLEVERMNLLKVNFELEKRYQNGSCILREEN